MRSLFFTSFLAITGVSAHVTHRVRAENADKPPTDRPASKYDFVIVGSGPGGGPLAANLAKANYSVLLIEAGDDRGDSLFQQVPAFYNNATNDPAQRWDYFVKHYADDKLNNAYPYSTWKTSDGKYYVGNNPPSGAQRSGVYYPRAGTLGGGSTSDALAAVMPTDSDWDAIAALTADKTWNSQRMHKFFQKIEHNYYLQNGSAGSSGHGFSGYLGTSQADPSVLEQSPMFSLLKAASSGANGSVLDELRKDLNAVDAVKTGATGLSGFTAHIDSKGRRVSARTYVSDVYNATNPDGSKRYKLDIWLNTLATKVVFRIPDATNVTDEDFSPKPVAIGVEYLQGKSLYSADPRSTKAAGTKGTIYAMKEVILSAGVFNTPQLLKLSGIGPADELKQFGINVLANSPGVGANLQDNQEYSVVALGKQSVGQSNCVPGAGNDPCLSDWKNGKGPYTQGPTNAMLLKSTQSTDGERDLLVWIAPQVNRGYWPQASGAPADFPSNAVSINIAKIHPRANSGTVKLRSANPQDTPEINFNFFAEGENEDLQALLEGVQWGRKVLGAVEAPVGPFFELYPCGADATGAAGRCSDSQLKQTIKTEAWSHNAVGTARVGPSNDTNAVLDQRFNVRGVRGLRVVDASVFPKAPGAFPILPTFLVAEKATEVILLDMKRKKRIGSHAKCNAGSPRNATKIRTQGTVDTNATLITPTLFN